MNAESKRDLLLSDTDLLSEGQLERLGAHWVTTLEQFLALGASEERRRSGAELLGVELDAFEGAIGRARELAPEIAESAVAYPFEDFLGCLAPLTEAPPAPLPLAMAEASLPDGADLTSAMPPVRDQGRRGACVSFGCTAVREYLTRRTDYDLSEQFLYWACKERDGHPGPGSYLLVGMQSLLEAGICREEEWPYNPNPIDGNEGQGPPPPGVETAAMAHRIVQSFCLVRRPSPPVDIQPFKAFLGGSSPRPVAIAVPLYDSFFNQATRRTGRVIMPLPGEDTRGGHAMCMVGYQDDAAAPGGGFFIVRNSWGEGWAYACDYGAGHALIPYDYIREHCWEAYTADAQPVAAAAAPPTTPRRERWRSALDYGNCSACGKRIITILDVAGRCTAPGCEEQICNRCWTVEQRRRCKAHGG